MKKIVITILISILAVSGCDRDKHAASTDPWYTGMVEPVPAAENEVPKQLIKVVPWKKRSTAISRLKTVPVLRLSASQATELLCSDALNPDNDLEKAAQEEDAIALNRENETKDPFFHDMAKEMQAWAKEHRKKATVVRNQKGKLKPYLVRGLVLCEPGSFSVFVKGQTIWIFHGSLGKRPPPPMKRRPVVVFLEQEPKTVYIDVSMAD